MQPGPVRRDREKAKPKVVSGCARGREPPSSFQTGRLTAFPLMSHNATSSAAMACDAYPVCPRGDNSRYSTPEGLVAALGPHPGERGRDLVDYRCNNVFLCDGGKAVANQTGRGLNLHVARRLPDLLDTPSNFKVDRYAERSPSDTSDLIFNPSKSRVGIGLTLSHALPIIQMGMIDWRAPGTSSRFAAPQQLGSYRWRTCGAPRGGDGFSVLSSSS